MQINCLKQTALYCTVLSLTLSLASLVHATPYTPGRDSDVIDILPAGSQTYQTRALVINTAKQPFSEVEPQITALMVRAYSQGDPRALGQAESLLEPYEKDPIHANDPEILSVRASILQSNHQFDESKVDLQKILKKIPFQVDTLLQLASINLVQGNFDESRKDCDQIRDMGMMVIRFACMGQVDDMTGKLQNSRDILLKLTQINNGLDTSQLRWLNLILADMAIRLDDPVLAKTVFEQLDGDTAPSLTARADWLLAHRAWAQTVQLLASHTDNDSLLLRLVIAELHLNSPNAKADYTLLSERIHVWQQRGEMAHQREEATFALFAYSPDTALDLAKSNWQKQRETADVVIYTNAAIHAHSISDMKIIQAWIKQTGFEYPRLSQTLNQAIQAG